MIKQPIELDTARFIVSSMKTESGERCEKEEKKQILECIDKHEELTLNFEKSESTDVVKEKELIQRYLYHDNDAKKWFESQIPDALKEKSIITEMYNVKNETPGELILPKPEKLYSVKMSRQQYEYIIDNAPLASNFDTPIVDDTKPKGFPRLDFIDSGDTISKKDNEKKHPSWLDVSRYKNCSIGKNCFIESLDNDIQKLNKANEISDYTLAASQFLTDVCFTSRSLSREQILITYLILQKITARNASIAMNKVFRYHKVCSKDVILTCFKRTVQGNMWESSKTYSSCGLLSYIDSLILITRIDLLIAQEKYPTLRHVTEIAKEINALRNDRMKLYFSCKKYFKTAELEKPDVIYSTDWAGKFIKRAGFVLRTGDVLE